MVLGHRLQANKAPLEYLSGPHGPIIAAGWVSYQLEETVAELWADQSTARLLVHADDVPEPDPHRPPAQRPSILFPVGYPARDAEVPDLRRKPSEKLSSSRAHRPGRPLLRRRGADTQESTLPRSRIRLRES